MKQVPERGDRITVSSNKRTGDRSYLDEVFEVIAVNSISVQCRRTKLKLAEWERRYLIFQLSEHDFGQADDFILE